MTAVVVILAFVLNLLVLQDRSATTLVALAEEPLVAGSILDIESVRLVPVDSAFEGLEPLLSEDELGDYVGWSLAQSVPAGGLIVAEQLAAPGSAAGLRSMSLPVPLEHAAGGSLTSGDRIDVIAVVDGSAHYIASGLEVISVSESGSGSIGNVTAHHVTVAVEPEEALRLAEALDAGTMELVRSTGAADVGEESDG